MIRACSNTWSVAHCSNNSTSEEVIDLSAALSTPIIRSPFTSSCFRPHNFPSFSLRTRLIRVIAGLFSSLRNAAAVSRSRSSSHTATALQILTHHHGRQVSHPDGMDSHQRRWRFVLRNREACWKWIFSIKSGSSNRSSSQSSGIRSQGTSCCQPPNLLTTCAGTN